MDRATVPGEEDVAVMGEVGGGRQESLRHIATEAAPVGVEQQHHVLQHGHTQGVNKFFIISHFTNQDEKNGIGS